jgi:hypothetical protein
MELNKKSIEEEAPLTSEEEQELKGLKGIEKLSLATKRWLVEGLIRGKKNSITAFQIGGHSTPKKINKKIAFSKKHYLNIRL